MPDRRSVIFLAHQHENLHPCAESLLSAQHILGCSHIADAQIGRRGRSANPCRVGFNAKCPFLQHESSSKLPPSVVPLTQSDESRVIRWIELQRMQIKG